eukprot:8094632-Ditylum_brightwellii.AAC.1
MEDKSDKNKQQGPTSDNTRDWSHHQQQKPTKHSNQQRRSWGGQHHSRPTTCVQGSSKPFGSCPAPPKQSTLPSTMFTPESGGKRQKR